MLVPGTARPLGKQGLKSHLSSTGAQLGILEGRGPGHKKGHNRNVTCIANREMGSLVELPRETFSGHAV